MEEDAVGSAKGGNLETQQCLRNFGLNSHIINDPSTVQITIWPKSTSVSAASSVLPPVLHFEDVLPA